MSTKKEKCGLCKHETPCPHSRVDNMMGKALQSESIEWDERIKTQIEYLGDSAMNTMSFRKCVFEAIEAIFQEAITEANESSFQKGIKYGIGNYKSAFEPLVLEKAITTAVETKEKSVIEILERHASWKPTEGHGSEEELGFQKGLMAEAKLIKSEILSIINPSKE